MSNVSNTKLKHRNTSRSTASLKSNVMARSQVYEGPPLDTLTITVMGLQLFDEDNRYYAIKVTFFDQLIISGIIKPMSFNEPVLYKPLATGTFDYDPSDYEKMCLFADHPLIVSVLAMDKYEPPAEPDGGPANTPLSAHSQPQTHRHSASSRATTPTSMHKTTIKEPPQTDERGVSCANIDILTMFLDEDKMCAKKRLRPKQRPPRLQRKSWATLPLLTLRLSAERSEQNAAHHAVLRGALPIRLTVSAIYNLPVLNDPETETETNVLVATKLPLHHGSNTTMIIYNKGFPAPRKFDNQNLYPSWETLRIAEEMYTEGDEKVEFDFENINNETDLNFRTYFSGEQASFTSVYGSFHRSLILPPMEKDFKKQLADWLWPLEVHCHSTDPYASASYMGFINLFDLLYPGVEAVQAVVPLEWFANELILDKCNTLPLLPPVVKLAKQGPGPSPVHPASSNASSGSVHEATGADDSPAFVVLEVRLARPLLPIVSPPVVAPAEIEKIYLELKAAGKPKRECTGRGQLEQNWKSTVRRAVGNLNCVPHCGMMDFCLFYRQLSETRTRVELMASFWMEASIYVNNNFIIKDYLKSDQLFEELVMLSHVCLVKSAIETLVPHEGRHERRVTAARVARQMQHIEHATELHLLHTAERVYCANNWRELGVCMLDVDHECASVCLNKALKLNMRHPLTLLVKGCMVFDEDPIAAEPFFMALLAFYPFWSTLWVIAGVYFATREMYRMSDQIAACLKYIRYHQLVHDEKFVREQGYELGDWWDTVPLLPGESQYYDAADLLIRIRALKVYLIFIASFLKLAEACLAQALIDSGETATYFHMLGLCCRLRGAVGDAICHLRRGIEKCGQVSFLKSLEAECLHRRSDVNAAREAFEKATNMSSTYYILLSMSMKAETGVNSMIVDLVRRQPSAYSWMALADNWLRYLEECESDPTMSRPSIINCAVACAVEALRYDRRARRAWVLLSRHVEPDERRAFCRKMAVACGCETDDLEEIDPVLRPCQMVGWRLPTCDCEMCDNVTV